MTRRSPPPARRPRRVDPARARPIDPVRARALLLLTDFETNPSPIRQPLEDAESRLPDERDRALLRNLVLETLRHRSRLDWLLSQYLRQAGPETLPPELRNVLRLGAVQAVRLERIPPHAIVSTTVDLVHTAGHPGAGGLVNAVTRRIVETGRERWNELDAPNAPGRASMGEGALAARLALRYSHPEWMVARWLPRLGVVRTERLLAWNNETAGTWLRLAPGTAVPEDARPGWVPDSAWCPPGARPAREDAFARGEFTVQDASAILVGHLPPRPRGVVLDLCAAPGTKARHLAERAEPNTRVLAIDRSWNRLRRLERDRARTAESVPGASLCSLVADGRRIPVRSGWDGVLIDAPCSNLGVIGRRVDVRWRVRKSDIAELAHLQWEILNVAAAGMRPGGWLVFSVCTIEPEETTIQRERFLAERPEWEPIPLPAFVPADARRNPGEMLLFPGEHGTDGTYAFAVRHRGSTNAAGGV